jgi:hypothetical protein
MSLSNPAVGETLELGHYLFKRNLLKGRSLSSYVRRPLHLKRTERMVRAVEVRRIR